MRYVGGAVVSVGTESKTHSRTGSRKPPDAALIDTLEFVIVCVYHGDRALFIAPNTSHKCQWVTSWARGGNDRPNRRSACLLQTVFVGQNNVRWRLVCVATRLAECMEPGDSIYLLLILALLMVVLCHFPYLGTVLCRVRFFSGGCYGGSAALHL